MDYFSKIINVFSSTKNETVEAESQESSGHSQYSHPPSERANSKRLEGAVEGTVSYAKCLNQMHPQGSSISFVSMNDHGIEDSDTHGQYMSQMQPQGNSMYDVSINGQRLESAASYSQPTNPQGSSSERPKTGLCRPKTGLCSLSCSVFYESNSSSSKF